MNVLVFSHRPEVREAIITAVGRRPAPDLPRVRYLEAGTIAEVLAAVDAGKAALAILDGEAQPTGGMGLSRQLKNEIDNCPPIIIAVRRKDDRWLATWSQADAVLVHPLDPLAAAGTVAEVLRSTLSALDTAALDTAAQDTAAQAASAQAASAQAASAQAASAQEALAHEAGV
jgi:DNA-binding response OmpR family regulator